MTIRKLIELLQEENPDHQIFVSSDAEGNSIQPIEGVYLAEDEDGDGDGDEVVTIFPQ